jgi:hypothetical protein
MVYSNYSLDISHRDLSSKKSGKIRIFKWTSNYGHVLLTLCTLKVWFAMHTSVHFELSEYWSYSNNEHKIYLYEISVKVSNNSQLWSKGFWIVLLEEEKCIVVVRYLKISIKYCYLRNKSWKPEFVLSFNMGWRILVCYPEPEARDTIYYYTLLY